MESFDSIKKGVVFYSHNFPKLLIGSLLYTFVVFLITSLGLTLLSNFITEPTSNSLLTGAIILSFFVFVMIVEGLLFGGWIVYCENIANNEPSSIKTIFNPHRKKDFIIYTFILAIFVEGPILLSMFSLLFPAYTKDFLGFPLFICLPIVALIVLFFIFFTPLSIVIDNKGIIPALHDSAAFARTHLTQTFLFYAFFLGMLFSLSYFGGIISEYFHPYAGQTFLKILEALVIPWVFVSAIFFYRKNT
ncbi:hypothetical protein K8R43_00190 [archaeon]|nr:hypothetical protein [archaeon]